MATERIRSVVCELLLIKIISRKMNFGRGEIKMVGTNASLIIIVAINARWQYLLGNYAEREDLTT